jgi:hypothetical protein
MRIALRHFLYKINEVDSDKCPYGEGSSQTPRHVFLRVFAEDAGKRPGIFEINVGLVCSVLGGNLTKSHELPKYTALFVDNMQVIMRGRQRFLRVIYN